MSAIVWGLPQGRDDGDNTPHAVLWSLPVTPGSPALALWAQGGDMLAALPCGSRRWFGTCFWTGIPTPLCPSCPFSFPWLCFHSAFSSQLGWPRNTADTTSTQPVPCAGTSRPQGPVWTENSSSAEPWKQSTSKQILQMSVFSLKTAYSVSKLNAIFYYSIGPP